MEPANSDGNVPDCNGNLIPDACDLDITDPDHDGHVSSDLNGNSTPDECDPDCQPNQIPDDYEIKMGVVKDVNENGIPDGCEP